MIPLHFPTGRFSFAFTRRSSVNPAYKKDACAEGAASAQASFSYLAFPSALAWASGKPGFLCHTAACGRRVICSFNFSLFLFHPCMQSFSQCVRRFQLRRQIAACHPVIVVAVLVFRRRHQQTGFQLASLDRIRTGEVHEHFAPAQRDFYIAVVCFHGRSPCAMWASSPIWSKPGWGMVRRPPRPLPHPRRHNRRSQAPELPSILCWSGNG